jgi:hypothetical protein
MRAWDRFVRLLDPAVASVSMEQQAWDWIDQWETAHPELELEAIEARSDGTIRLWWY